MPIPPAARARPTGSTRPQSWDAESPTVKVPGIRLCTRAAPVPQITMLESLNGDHQPGRCSRIRRRARISGRPPTSSPSGPGLDEIGLAVALGYRGSPVATRCRSTPRSDGRPSSRPSAPRTTKNPSYVSRGAESYSSSTRPVIPVRLRFRDTVLPVRGSPLRATFDPGHLQHAVLPLGPDRRRVRRHGREDRPPRPPRRDPHARRTLPPRREVSRLPDRADP